MTEFLCREDEKQMKAARIVFSVLCALALVLTFLLLGVAITASRTVLNADFVVAQLTDIPVYQLFADQVKKQVPPEASFLLPVIDEAGADLEPWARQQAAVLVQSLETYLKGEQPFAATISFVEPKQYLGARLAEVLRQSGVLGLGDISEQDLQTFVDMIMGELDSRVPDEFVITESYLDAGTLSGIRSARDFAHAVTWGLRLLPVVAALLLLLIAALQQWRGRRIAAYAGVSLLAAGLGSILARFMALVGTAGRGAVGPPGCCLCSAARILRQRVRATSCLRHRTAAGRGRACAVVRRQE